jgi:hypothetical protein
MFAKIYCEIFHFLENIQLNFLKVKEEGDRMLEELRELLEEEEEDEGGVEGEEGLAAAAVPPSLFRQDSVGLYSCQVRLLSMFLDIRVQ